MKFLIVPGMAKAGTTFLYDQLASRKNAVNYPSPKELGYLKVGSDLERYLKFFPDHDPEKAFLDATPQYSDAHQAFCVNAKKMLSKHEVKIIVCLRDPVARAFSHYRHDLSTHFFTSIMGQYSFFSESSVRKYIRPYADMVRSFIDTFGAENVHGFSFAQSGDKLPDSVLDFLNISREWRLDRSINPAKGGGLPRLIYHKDRYSYVEQGGKIYAVPPKALMISTTLFSQLRFDFPPDLARQMLGNSVSWTKELDRAKLGASWKHIQKDYDTALRLLGMEPDNLPTTGTIPYKSEFKIHNEVISKLEEVTSVKDVVSDIYERSNKGEVWISGNENKDDARIEISGQIQKIQNVFINGTLDERVFELKRTIEQFGPVKQYLSSYLNICIQKGDLEEVIRVLELKSEIKFSVDRDYIFQILDAKLPFLDKDKVRTIKIILT